MHYYLCLLILMIIIGQSNALRAIPQAMLCDPSEHFCSNGGTCFSEGGVQKCRCPRQYEGERCETMIPLQRVEAGSLRQRTCTHLCFNGGKCYFENKTMLCRCRENYSGLHCERRDSEITPNKRPKPWPDGSPQNTSTIMPSQTHSTSTVDPGLDGHTVQTNSTNRTSIIDGHVWRSSYGTTMTTVIIVIILLGAIIIVAIVVFCHRRRQGQAQYDTVEREPGQEEEEHMAQNV